MKTEFLRTFSPLDTDIFCVRKITYLPHFDQMTFHNHDGYEIWLILNDGASFYVESQGKKLERGDMILIPPYALHYVETQQDIIYDRIFINMKESFMNHLEHMFSARLTDCFTKDLDHSLNVLHLSEEELKYYIDLTNQLHENLNYPTYGSHMMVHSLMAQILVFLNRKALHQEDVPFTNKMPKIVKDCISFINEHLTENVSMSQISAYVHHNSDYINRKFKEFTGTTVQQFVLIKRITLAQKYLRQGTSPCDACYLSGFNNYSNFSRTFSKHIGYSPKQYQIMEKEEA